MLSHIMICYILLLNNKIIGQNKQRQSIHSYGSKCLITC